MNKEELKKYLPTAFGIMIFLLAMALLITTAIDQIIYYNTNGLMPWETTEITIKQNSAMGLDLFIMGAVKFMMKKFTF